MSKWISFKEAEGKVFDKIYYLCDKAIVFFKDKTFATIKIINEYDITSIEEMIPNENGSALDTFPLYLLIETEIISQEEADNYEKNRKEALEKENNEKRHKYYLELKKEFESGK